MKTVARLITLTALLLLVGCAPDQMGRKEAPASPNPRQVVTAYMDALQAGDYPQAMALLGLTLPPQTADKVREMVQRSQQGQLPFRWQVTSYVIKAVRIDGGLAEVTVEESSRREADPLIKAILGRLGDFGSAVKWGDITVTEKFVLVRLAGQWRFDSGHSGVAFDTLPVSELMELASKSKMPSPALQKTLADFVNQVGIGQLVQTFNAPMLPLVAAVAIPSFERARVQGQLTACRSNLRNIGTALEMYSTDALGRFPTQLSRVAPNYLQAIPTCPSAGVDTYSPSYESATTPDVYTVYCKGAHHEAAGMPADFPLYTSTQGLVAP